MHTAPLAGQTVISKVASAASNTNNFGQQYGVRHRKVTHRVKTGRYTTAHEGYRAWRMRTG